MLAEQRYEIILEMLEKNKSVTVTELTTLLATSESTIRRDITALHKASKLIKVFGGAIAVEDRYIAAEPTVAQKAEQNQEEKRRIAKYASSLIEKNEFVYIDAGTTTAYMLDYLDTDGVTFVTNGVSHAKYLAARGAKVFMVGGQLKSTTEAIVGSHAAKSLEDYHFSKGFFGTNGISRQEGFTTPDMDEALIKRAAMKQCRKAYVLCDATKFNQVSSVTFAALENATVLTDREIRGYEKLGNVVVVSGTPRT